MMVNNNHKKYTIWLGFAFSILFLYLAFRNVTLNKLVDSFNQANYWYLIPAVAMMFFSHWLRAVRWRYILLPIKEITRNTLFSATLIGYMGNVILPAHLGEFFRSYVVSKKQNIPMASTFATIVIERLVDVWSLLLTMAITLIFFPFPNWVTKSGYIMFVFAFVLFGFLLFIKNRPAIVQKVIHVITAPLPGNLKKKAEEIFTSFIDGLIPLKRWHHYIIVSLYSILIWACYASIFYFVFLAFDFITQYNLVWSASLVVLVITTISIVVPSSPGYIGTYHWLCQLSLGLFGIPETAALSYAILVHGVSFIPVFLVGLVLVWYEGMNIVKIYERMELEPGSE